MRYEVVKSSPLAPFTLFGQVYQRGAHFEDTGLSPARVLALVLQRKIRPAAGETLAGTEERGPRGWRQARGRA